MKRIDPEYIKKNLPKDAYTLHPVKSTDGGAEQFYRVNPDGSLNLALTLYFKPQSYFYLGFTLLNNFAKRNSRKRDLTG